MTDIETLAALMGTTVEVVQEALDRIAAYQDENPDEEPDDYDGYIDWLIRKGW